MREIKEEADDVPPQDLSTDETVTVEPQLEHEWETETSPPSTTWVCPEENTGAESSCVDSSSPTGKNMCGCLEFIMFVFSRLFLFFFCKCVYCSKLQFMMC